MRASRAALVSTRRASLSPLRNARHAALVVGASALFLGAVTLAADEPAAKLDAPPAADAAATPDTATGPGALQGAEIGRPSEAGATPTTPADHNQQAGAKSRKGGKEHKSDAAPEAAPTSAPPTSAQVQPEERVCRPEQAPGSRVRKMVCTTAAEQNAKTKDGQEYLKRAYEDSLHPTTNAGAFTGEH